MRAPIPGDVQLALNRLKSLHEGELGLIEIVDCGPRAIPALRELLFTREPSGVYQPRCLAVQALRAIRAYDALFDYLRVPYDIPDAVERVGEEAVVSAAARALTDLREERVFELLLSIAEEQLLPGVIDALGAFERPEAIPHFVSALAEDECRPSAEAALRRLGPRARASLLVAAAAAAESPMGESETELRKRRSALNLLIEIGVGPQSWPVLRHLTRHRDPKVSMRACEIALAIAPAMEKRGAVRRLMELLTTADWPLNQEIERRILAHSELAKEIVGSALETGAAFGDSDRAEAPSRRVLLRLAGLIGWRGHGREGGDRI